MVLHLAGVSCVICSRFRLRMPRSEDPQDADIEVVLGRLDLMPTDMLNGGQNL